MQATLNPQSFFEKVFSKNLNMCLNMLLSNDFGKPLKYLVAYRYISNFSTFLIDIRNAFCFNVWWK